MAAVAETPQLDQQVDLNNIPLSPKPETADGTAEKGAVEGDDVTVFHDPDNFTVKHPLQNKWTLWFTKPPSGKETNWNDLLKPVIQIDSVEGFWGVYNNISPVSELALKSDYHLFKEGIRPEWEDQQNKHGGKWSYVHDKRAAGIDKLWLNVLLAAIGETLEDEGDDEITGVVVNVRKGFYRISVWTRSLARGGPRGDQNSRGTDLLLKIGGRFKEVLELGATESLEFVGHTETAHVGSSRARAKLTV